MFMLLMFPGLLGGDLSVLQQDGLIFYEFIIHHVLVFQIKWNEKKKKKENEKHTPNQPIKTSMWVSGS